MCGGGGGRWSGGWGGGEKGVREGRGERSGALPEAERRRAPNQPKRVFLPLVHAR